ncbi:hypothetical protein [Methylobacterium sp. A54F]
MQDDPLYQKIYDDTKPGDPPFTTSDAVARWGYSTGHTHRVLDWMAGSQQPPLMDKNTTVSPYQWERI